MVLGEGTSKRQSVNGKRWDPYATRAPVLGPLSLTGGVSEGSSCGRVQQGNAGALSARRDDEGRRLRRAMMGAQCRVDLCQGGVVSCSPK